MVAEKDFCASLEDLSGKVAVVTGGAAGIGLETTKYLARKGCTVYVASRNQEKSLKGIAEIEKALDGQGGPIKFHLLDLASIQSSLQSAKRLREVEACIDIIIANAGVSMINLSELSCDGYERLFATNHMGHFAFITALLGLVEKAAIDHGDARIVVTGSVGYTFATGLDYEALTTTVPGDGNSYRDLKGAFARYGNSKLANIYFTRELDKRIQQRGIKNVYCNCCHPGYAGGTGLGSGGFESIGGKWAEWVIGFLLPNTHDDAAKTQVFLSASKVIPQEDVHAQYWVPVFSWTMRYIKCQPEEPTTLAQNQQEQEKLWAFSENAVSKFSQ